MQQLEEPEPQLLSPRALQPSYWKKRSLCMQQRRPNAAKSKEKKVLNHVCVFSCSVCLTPCDPMDHSPPGSSVHGIFHGKNNGAGCYFLVQGIFPTQGLNPHLLHLLHWQADSLPLVPHGKPHL